MSTILIVGATGFIGLPVALALRRGGYTVYGLARTEEKAQLLAQKEIIPILFSGDINTLSSSNIVPKNVEVIIDTAGLYGGSLQLLEQCKIIGGNRRPTDPKLTFVYTGGIWVHGSSSVPVSEATPLNSLTPAADIVAWRPDVEHTILAARSVLDVVIIRPGVLYGGNGTLWSAVLGPVTAAVNKSPAPASVEIVGAAEAVVGTIHKEDLASLYLAIIDRLSIVAASTYPVFNATTYDERWGSIVESFAKHSGFKGTVTYKASEEPFGKAVITEPRTTHLKALGLLDWKPRQESLVGGMKVWALAMSAWQKVQAA